MEQRGPHREIMLGILNNGVASGDLEVRDAAALLSEDGFAEDRHEHTFTVDMRYVGQ